MARRPPPEPRLPPEVIAALAGMGATELEAGLAQVLDLAGRRAAMITPQPVSHRRQRAKRAYGLRIKVSLVGARPPIWRRLDVPSTLGLDEVHGLLQAVFGWTDSHLYRFTLGRSAFDAAAEHFLCDDDVEEGEGDGVPAWDVRLDEVLAEPGDQLRYTYDYGDEWVHLLKVEQVLDEPGPVRLATGRGSAPEEDSGGVWAWNERSGPPLPFAVEQVAAALADWEAERTLPEDLVTLRQQLDGLPEQVELEALIEAADLREGPVAVDEQATRALLRPYSWLLDRVGDGVALTRAGYLPPPLVVAAMSELALDPHWIGAANREDLTIPVWQLRASAQALGLLRVSKGRLLRTRAGVAGTADPTALWKHVVRRVGTPPARPFLATAEALVLLGTAAGVGSRTGPERMLEAVGWQAAGGRDQRRYVWAGLVDDVLRVLGEPGGREAAPGPALQALARAALRTP